MFSRAFKLLEQIRDEVGRLATAQEGTHAELKRLADAHAIASSIADPLGELPPDDVAAEDLTPPSKPRKRTP